MSDFLFVDQFSAEVVDLIFVASCIEATLFPVKNYTTVFSFYFPCISAPGLPHQRNFAWIIHSDYLSIRGFPIVIKMVFSTYGTYPFGKVHSQSPSGNIHLMCTVIQGFACTPMPQPVPIIMDEAVFIRYVGRRALPKVIIQPIGHRSGFVESLLALVGIPGFCQIDPSNNSVMKFFDTLGKYRGRTPLGAHLHHAVVLACRLYCQLALSWVMAQGFFDIHMLPGLTAHNGKGCMPMIWCGYINCIYRLVLQNFTAILFRFWGVFLFGLHLSLIHI